MPGRVGLHEDLRLLWIAGGDHDQVVPVVFHHLEQRVDRLLPEVVPRRGGVPGEGVCLVDEQHAAERLLNLVGGLDRGLADVARDQVGARHLHGVPAGQQAMAP
jgi:hypothetical protein